MAEMNVADSMEQYLLKDSDVPSDVLKQYNVEPVVDTKQPKMMEAPDTQQVLNDTQQLGNTRQQTDELMNTMQQADTAVGFEYAPDPQFMEKVKNSKAYRLYFNTKPEQLEYAKNLASRIQQPLEKVLASEESLKVAEEMDARRRKIAALLPPDERQFAMDEVNKEYQLRPEYKAVEGLPDSVDRAIALHHYENVRELKGIVDSFCAGVNNQTKAGSVIRDIEYRDYMGETITEEQEKQYNEAKRQQREMAKYVPDFFDNPLAAIAYGTGDQGTMMGRQTAKTQLYAIPLAGIVGAGTTALAGPVAGAAAAKSTWATATKWGTGLEMFKETVGGYYRDYKQYRKEDGSQLLSNEEARFAATLAAAGEAYIEVGNFDKIIDMLGNGAVKTATKVEAQQVLANIVANSADKASFKAQLSYYMKNRFGKAIAAGWSEMLEEGKQSIYTDTVHNAAALYTNYKGRKGDLNVIGAGDILKNAAEETFAAGPSIIGMTGIGHITSSSKYVNKIADWLTSKHEDVLTAQKTAGGINMVEQLIEDARKSELAKNSRDVYDQLVTNSLEGTQYENVIVDTELLTRDDKDGEGNKIFYQLATAAGMTEEEADNLKGAQLKIRVADYLKVVEDENVRDKLRTLISFDERDNCFKRIQENAKEFRKEFDKRVDEQYQRVADRIENWVGANIQGEQEQAIMTQVLFEFMDPKQGVQELRKQYQAKIDEYIQPIVEQMRSGMKQGVTLFMTDDDGNVIANGQGVDVHIGGATRISNNDAWYSNYFKANKKAPSEKEMKQIARDALLGNNPYGVITGLEGADAADLIEAEEQMRSMFDNYDSVMASLDNLDKVVENLDASELNAMDGLTKEGVEAYKAAKEFLLKANDNVRKSAAASAILVAHHADVWAGYMRQMGHNVTAMDYVTKRLGWGDGNVGAGEKYNQITNRAFAPWYTGPNEKLTLDTPIEVVNLSSKYKGLTWQEAYNQFTNDIQRALATIPDSKGKTKGVINKHSNVEIVWPKNSVGHSVAFDNGHTRRDPKVAENRHQTDHYEVINVLKEVLEKGIMIEEHGNRIIDGEQEKHGKTSLRSYRLYAPVLIDGENLVVARLLVLRMQETFQLANDDVTDLELYDHTIAKREKIKDSEIFPETPAKIGLAPQGTITKPYKISIRQMLTNVNDNNDQPFINADGSGNFDFLEDTDTFMPYKQRIDYEAKRQFKEVKSKVRKTDGYQFAEDRDRYVIVRTPLFKQWFGDWQNGEVPKELLDENGEPKVLYHGTSNEFDTFDINALGSNTGNYGHLGAGFYFAEDKKEAAGYGDTVMPVFLRMKKPFTGTKEQMRKYKDILDLGDEETFVDKDKLLDVLKEKEPMAYEFAKLLETNDYEKAWEIIWDKYTPEQVNEAKVNLDDVYRWLHIPANKYGIEKLTATLGEGLTKQDYAYVRSLDFALDLGEDKAKTEEFVEALKADGYDGVIYNGEYVVFEANQIKSAESNSGNFDINNPNIYNQAAGQKAETANLPMLENAMAAYEAGKSAEDIYRETGWHIGMDGKWRFEIPDNLDLIDASKFPVTNHGVRLEDIYPNKALYEAYPWLADIIVIGKKLEDTTLGYADSKNGVIALNTKFIGNKTRYTIKFGDSTYTKQEINGVSESYVDENGRQMPLVVERAIKVLNTNKAVDKQNYVANSIVGLEHILERKEGAYEHAIKSGADQERIFQLWESKEETKDILQYIKSLGPDFQYEMEVFSERDDAYTHKNLDGTVVHEIQHLIQDKEGFAVGGNPEAVQKQIVRQKEKTLEAMKNIHPNAWDVYVYFEETVQAFSDMNFDKMDQAQKDYDRIVKHYGLSKDETDRIVKLGDAYKKLEEQEKEKDNTVKYFHLHGEQEARLASRKAELSTQIVAGKDNFENGYDNILKEWSKDKSEELKSKGERLAELENAANDIDNSADWTDAMEEEYEELSSMDELVDLADELSSQSLQNFRYLGLLDKYEREVLSTIDFNNTIVVFGGEAVAGAALNQQAARIQGATEITATGQHIIHIMETADQSTFMHEMAHVFFDDLHDLAMDENAPEQVKKDWQNLEKWTAWKEGQLEEYKGTATYDEFKALDAAIRTAQETGKAMYNGQECSLQSLLNRWAQERFARGFEEYLHSGKAPTKPLRNAFSKFKKWLTDIYRAVTGAGAKPSEQVRKIMDRMLATQDEIDSAMEEAQLDALEKKGLFKYLNGTSQEMWEKNLEEIKEDVAAKVMKIAMKDMTDKAKAERAEMLKAEREAAYERISQEPVFVAYQYLKQNPNLNTSDVVETMTDMSLEEYATELKARGGSLDAAVDQYMKDYEAELKEPSRKEIKAAAEQAIAQSHYTKLAMVFEIQALEKFVLDEESLVRKLKGIKDEDKAEGEAAPKAERLINYVQKKQGKEHRIYRDALEGYIQKIQKYAEQKIAGMAIKEATNPAMWEKLAADNADDSINSFAKVEYGMATKQRRVAFFYHTMAEIAEKNRKEVDSKIKTLMAHTRTMMREKNMPANDRYLYNHLMFCFGLSNKDALKPPGYPDRFEDVLLTYDENLELSYVDQDGKIDLPDWLTSAMAADSGEGRYKDGYVSLRMDQLQLLYNVMENIYKAGRDAKKLKTTRDAQGNILTVDEVVGEIVANAAQEIPEREVTDATGMESESWREAVYRRANEAYVNLLKPETILRQLGNSAIKYIYNPIKIAADNEMVETEHLAEKIRGITDAYHDSLVEMYRNQGVNNPEAEANKAMKELRSKKQYKIGTSNLTKENLIAVALNWGTDINRKRVLEGFNVSQGQVEKALANLNSADWQMIINIWNLFDDYWPRLVEVEANCSGVVLEKQEAVPFTIMDNTGFAYNLQGGYYPIKYDRHKNMRIGDHASDEAKRMSMSGMSRLGMGLGNTKERMETVKYKLRLDFGVFQEALGDTVHNICMREAVRDVNKVIRDQNFSEFMQATYGQATTKMLENWILDCWAKEPRQKDPWEQAAQWIRSKQTMATLGFRTSTALLNFCNISYVIDYLGATRTMAALKNFYAHPSAQFEFALDKSVFLRERAETMDRDMGSILKQNREKFGEEWYDKIENQAFWLISRTDLMLACPMWLSEYQRVYQESMDKHLSPEHAEREAVLAGDAAVRRVFGSGQIQDLAGVQKSSEFTKMLTMYYSFFSVVHNALMMKAFETRQAWRKSAKVELNEDGTVKATERDYKEAAKALVPIAEGFIFWMLIPAAMEACIRASYGDDKDKEAKNLAKKTLTTIAGTAVGGIPLLREFVPSALEAAFGGRYYGMGGVPIAEEFDQLYKVISTAQSRKKSKLDVLRESLRALTPITGLPTTMTDAMVSVMQFMDHGKLTKDDILHYIWAITFDKNPDAKKKK